MGGGRRRPFRLRSGRADAVFVDYSIGDGSRAGAEVVREVRAKDPHLPLVAVAERADVTLASEAIAAGASDFLVRSEPLAERVATLPRSCAG